MQTRLHYCQVEKSRATTVCGAHCGLCVKGGARAPICLQMHAATSLRFPVKGGKPPLPASRLHALYPRKPPVCANCGLFTSRSYQPAFQETGFSQSRSTWRAGGGDLLPHSSWTQGSPGRRWAFSPNFSQSQSPRPPLSFPLRVGPV